MTAMMDRLYHHAGLSLIIAWMGLWPLTWFGVGLPPWGLIVAVVLGALVRPTKIGTWVLAILGHLSLALIMLVAAWMLAQMGRPLPPTPAWALGVYLGLSLVFYFSLSGLIRLDIYALAFRPWARMMLTLALVAYCLLTHDVFVAFGLSGAWALHVGRIGPPNLLDHLHHPCAMLAVLVFILS